MLDQFIKAYNEAVFDTNREEALNVIENALDSNLSPEDIVFKMVVPAIDSMIKDISNGYDLNLAQHFMASQIAAEVTENMILKFNSPPEVIGRIILGTSRGDFHGLGKRIVQGCLKASMLDTIDLGLNVSAEQFVDQAVVHNAQVIGISSMMVHTASGEDGAIGVRRILKERGLEGQIKIIVGGAPYRYDPELYRIVQADAWAPNGIEAGKIITDLIRQVKS